MSRFIGCFNNKNIQDEFLTVSDSYNQINTGLLANGKYNVYLQEEVSVLLFGNLYNAQAVAFEAGISNTTSDAHIFLELVKKDVQLIKKLDGEFTAILIFPKKTVIIRDRHGASLQVYYTQNLFCSNIFLLKQASKFSIELNQESLSTFMAYGYIPSPVTALKGVSKLTAGTMLVIENGLSKTIALYNFDDFKSDINKEKKIEEAAIEFEELHQKAIKDRIKDKKTIGLFLSGGYDSGGNVHALRQVYQGDLSSYSIGFKDNPWSELPLAKKLSDVYQTNHTDFEIDGSEIKYLPEIVAEMGDPFQESGLMINYLVNKLVSNNRPDIILGGDGNDQHFGVAMRELGIFYKISKMGMMPMLRGATSILQSNIFDRDNFLFKLRFQGHKISHILENDRFGFNNQQLKTLLKEFAPYCPPASPIQSASSFDDLCLIKQFNLDIAHIVNEVILFKGSKMASLFDNNLSFPYMSTDIYNYLRTMPRELKTKGDQKSISKGLGVAKYIHKYYLKPHLPSEITDRKKQGGFAPLPVFFNNKQQRDKIFNYILSSKFVVDFTNQDEVSKLLLIYSNANDQEPYWFWNRQTKATQVWNLLVISIWWDLMTSKDNSLSFL